MLNALENLTEYLQGTRKEDYAKSFKMLSIIIENLDIFLIYCGRYLSFIRHTNDSLCVYKNINRK